MIAYSTPPTMDVPPTETQVLSLQTLYTRLESFRREKFSGLVTLSCSTLQPWKLCFFMGRLIYATGGDHPIRRWQRQVLLVLPEVEREALTQSIAGAKQQLGSFWEYQLLSLWVDQGQINREQAIQIICGIVAEVFFDIVQQGRVTLAQEDMDELPKQIALLDPLQVMKEQVQAWKQWQGVKAAARSPNGCPQIVKPAQLQHAVSERLFSTLNTLLDGQRTIRDIAVQMKRTPLEVVTSLMPYLQTGVIALEQVPDLSISVPELSQSPTSSVAPLIACVDDSTWVIQSLGKLIQESGYRFLAIQDPLRAMDQLLSQKPDLILLDLRMPNTNGYELCSQLRGLSLFREKPILILTGNDGLIDRVRARMVGATDFLSKSVDDTTLLTTIRKYLPVRNTA